MSKAENEVSKRGAAAAKAKEEPTLFRQLEDLTKASLNERDHGTHAALHNVVMALAAAKVAAALAEQSASLSDEARALLDRVKAL